MITILTGVKWYLIVVFIFIILIITDAELILKCGISYTSTSFNKK